MFQCNVYNSLSYFQTLIGIDAVLRNVNDAASCLIKSILYFHVLFSYYLRHLVFLCMCPL